MSCMKWPPLPPLLLAMTLALASPGAANAAASPIPPGDGQQTVDLGRVSLEVVTWRPTGCPVTGALIVFHGNARDAAAYRDHAMPLAEQFCMLVVAPRFDAERFPPWRYQRGGIARDGVMRPPEAWTVALVPRLAAWIRQSEGNAALPYALIGHSAGGQFLTRVAAFADIDATRIIIANPSTWVWPSLDVAAPYGFGGLYEPEQAEAALRRYLARPITVLLGGADVGTRELVRTAVARAQGATRLQRGQNVFQAAESFARVHNWAFNWRLAIVPGVGHAAAKMFASAQAAAALRP